MGGTFICPAMSPKMVPTGALLKYALVAFFTVGAAAASEFDGKWPPSVHMVTCWSWADSHSTNAMAAAWFLAFVGTPSHEPPQLVAPPGSTGAMSHLPAYASPAWPRM